jgi:hypothetical protein
MPTQATQPVELFFSYSHKDEELRDELERHLAMLKRTGVITTWHDRKIGGGTEWAGAIDDHLERAHVILLLISADFLASDYCYDVELRRAMERHHAGTARVIPVILRAAAWESAPFSALQAVPKNARPVTSWVDHDEAFADVARAISRAVAELKGATAGAPKSPDGSPRRTYYPGAQRQLIDESTRGFVGRSDVQHAVDRFLARDPRGYFVLEGAPGQGKTSLAAWFVKARGLVHHFVNRGGGRADPQLILQSLLEQLGTATLEEMGSRPVAALALALEEALRQHVSQHGPTLVVIDALNELVDAADADDDVSFLPAAALPPGAYFLVTSQPGARLDRWMENLADVPFERHRLQPLGESDVRRMIQERLPNASDGVISSIVDAAEGTPLYVRATLDAFERQPDFDPRKLPKTVEGYLRRATRHVVPGDLAHTVLGLLAVSRKPLSVPELSEIAGAAQRKVDQEAILPFKQFLSESVEGYTFYHQRFHEFVVRDVVYPDEVKRFHAMMAEWLDRPRSRGSDERWASLAHHLYYAGETARLLERIDASFLADKLRRVGYGVLDDLELVVRSLLDVGDPATVERSVNLVEGLRSVIGSALVDSVATRVQPNRAGIDAATAAKPLEPVVDTISGLDVHAALIPRGSVTADFIQVVPMRDRLVAAIGDAPSAGLKSAFVARFIASLWQRLVQTAQPLDLGRVLDDLDHALSANKYFEMVSMLCLDINPSTGIVGIVNAGHPYPVLFSARRRRCDLLPVRGRRLHESGYSGRGASRNEVRHAEVEPGDVIVMVSDGLTEGGRLDADAYGTRYTAVVQQQAEHDARTICRAILQDWIGHPRDPESSDDTAVIVIKVTR